MDERSRASAADERKLALYVHVPFCEAKCAYCHFAIDPRRPEEAREERYTRAVLGEMAAAAPGAADNVSVDGEVAFTALRRREGIETRCSGPSCSGPATLDSGQTVDMWRTW